MAVTLYDLLVRDPDNVSSESLLDRFLEYAADRGLTLYTAQEEALLAVLEGHNVILQTPTGSGKSLVAMAMLFAALARGRRAVYTCPIKALVNEKWRDLCREFGPDNVGLSTGDASVNRQAPILCCTAEILANIALRRGARAPVDDLVIDEFHWYADRERGVAWQVPLLTLPQTRFLLMSATLGDTRFFEEELTRLTGRPTVTVSGTERPVPLEYEWSERPLAQTIERLLAEDRAPIYVVHFTQAEAAESAQDFMSLPLCTRAEKEQIAAELETVRFNSPYGPEIRKWLRHGIGLHHAGLLPKYRVLVERLAQRGLLKLICGTDTLGVGVNIPIRTVVFTRLCKFDGEKVKLLTARDFHQIAGRAGRKGFDERGSVVVQAPEEVIERKKQEEKAARDGRKVARRKLHEPGRISWDRKTFERLIAAPPERLTSRFQVTPGMLLHVLSRRDEDGCRALQQIIRRCHDSPRQKKEHFRRAWQLFRSMVNRNVIEIVPRSERDGNGLPKLRVNVELQEDFSLDQTLSLYLLETLLILDPQSPQYALDVLSLVEAILEDPEPILRRQLERVKAEALAAMKAEGVPYEERMERLEELEYPKPNRDFIYGTFNAFAERHPWVGQENIRPKSIAREMYETFRSFDDYVRDYQLQRVEGLLLRHLHSVYKVLKQTVPEPAKTDAVREMELYFGTMIRTVDSSLLEEWEQMRDPEYERRVAEERARITGQPVAAPAPADAALTANPATFTALVRNRIFTFLRAWSTRQFDTALAQLNPAADAEGNPWSTARLQSALETYLQEHLRLSLDPEARNRRHTHVQPAEDGRSWTVQQMLIDPDGHNDWVAEWRVDLAASDTTGEPVMQLLRLGPLV
ncbi:DEAD/DEAH box helicase [Limisphaera sp. 4302-co]|uniref:DEAD/DEAH box helicase n=1 Tax=Limisphaera sp. 4302-co TaxID=3400417 RepID=UPI003C269CBB